MQTNLGSMKKEARTKCDTALMEAHALIDWEGLRTELMEIYRREIGQGGGEGEKFMDPVPIFKAVLLGHWHNLSDPKLKEALHMRTDFMDFCGMGHSGDAPDEITLRRFRSRLITSGRLAGMLAGVNAKLRAHGLVIRGPRHAAADDVHVQPSVRPKRDTIDNAGIMGAPHAIETGNRRDGMSMKYPKLITCIKTRHSDPDATWIRKNKKKYFGYTGYVHVANEDNYIRRSVQGGQQK
ncbi:transposase [Nitrosospira lacus]|nr:transposase [Nitrosospira lacus]